MNPSTMIPERAIPLYGLLPTTIAVLVPLIFALIRIKSTPGRFVLGAVWLRLVMDAYAPYTTPKLGAGLSINAIVSILVVVVGLFMVGIRYLRLVWLVPVYLLVAIIGLSAFVNHVPMTMVEQTTKFAYLILIILGTLRGGLDVTPARMAGGLMVAYLPPLFFLATSVALGITKQGESDGSVSYVGGYTHESVFSIALAGGLIAIAFATNVRGWLRVAMTVAIVVGIGLANYRTTAVAMLPLILWLALVAPLRTLSPRSRPLAVTAGGCAALLAIMSVNIDLGARVQSVVDFASNPTDFMRPVSTFTRQERSTNSGRAYVWAQYAEAYAESRPLAKTIGHGPDSWEMVFSVYAQNTILSYLYEFGFLGAVTVCLLWLTMMVPLLSVPRHVRIPLIAMHGGFLILNLSTMPLWQIEGVLMYGLICGMTLAYAYQARVPRRSTHAGPAYDPDRDRVPA
jgi:hypothetical protein